MTSSEDTSAFMTRGEYVTDKKRNIIGSYDDQRAAWGATHRDGLEEASPPGRSSPAGSSGRALIIAANRRRIRGRAPGSFFGCMDLCGFPKAAFYMHQAHWIEDRPILQLIPHWNWAGQEGKPIKVMAIANCDTVALSLNGQSLGEKPVDKFDFAEWEVPYAPGRLEAVGKKAGQEVSRCVVETTGEPVALRLVPDRAALAGDGWDAQPVTVQVVDAQGRVVPTADPLVEFEINGPGAIIGHGNGDPNCHEPEKGGRRSLFNGLAQVIVQSQAGGIGPLTLRAKAAGLKAAETTLQVQSAAAPPAVEVVLAPLALQSWRMSPVSGTSLNPNMEVADNDQNTWTTVEAGKLQTFSGGAFALYRVQFEPSAALNAGGGSIVFPSITGKAQVWLAGTLLGRKDKFDAGALTVPLPPGKGSRTLSVLIEAEPGKQAGFGKLVVVKDR